MTMLELPATHLARSVGAIAVDGQSPISPTGAPRSGAP